MFDGMAEPRELRPHQSNAIQMLRQSLGQGFTKVVLQAPTGFGKSITAAKIIESALSKGKRVMFTVPRLTLVDQTVLEFEREGINHIGVIQSNHPRTDATAPVQVATVQTLGRQEIGSRPFDIVIQDECHIHAKIIPQLMDAWPKTVFIGLSATPWARGMGLIWQDLKVASTIPDLIEQGYLSKFHAYAPDDPDLKGIKVARGDYVEGQLATEMSKPALVGSVVNTWLEKGEGRPTLVFGVNCAHAQVLQEQFNRAGVSAGYCDAHTDRVERHLLAKQFREGDIKLVCSVRTLTTGVDWPVSCIVDAAPTKSEILHVQKIGRGLRINPGTEDCLILDHAGNSLRLGLVTSIYHDTLDKTKSGEKQKSETTAKLPKPCSKCETLHLGLICPACGHERKPIPGIETVDGELIEITDKKRVFTMAEKQEFWSMALWLDDDRQKGGKLAKGLYKGKFGVWPQGLTYDRMKPDFSFWNYEKSSRIRYAKRMAKLNK